MSYFEHSLKCRCSNSLLPRSSQFFIPEAKPHYAPDRLVDVEHIKLELSVDLNTKTLLGKCTTSFRAVAPNIAKITFDAIDLKTSKIFDVDGAELRFLQTDGKLTIFLRKTPLPGDHGVVVIHYAVTEPRAGLYFIAPDKDYPERPLQLWTQGQDQDNRFWIPCHDAPNEKASTEMLITVDEHLTAISNGKLLSVNHDKEAKKRTFHWKQSIPHASYLITLCVGEFAEIKDVWKNSKGEEIPVQYFTVPGRERETKFSFSKTPKMLDFFSKKIGVDYPYEKYAQVVAWDFIYGGMENTSSTTQTEYTLHPESVELDYSSEPLVAHELAHQWFGDLLTCKEWSHAWLNEGFATYFESLWTEHEHGKDEFLFEVYANEKIYKAEDSGSYRRPIVTNVYLSPSDIFDRHLYEKGGRVLHMLRRLVGDELWWKAIHQYTIGHFAKTVETVDLQRVFEETTGQSLGWFFEQWVFKAGHPDLEASYEWIEDRKQTKLTITQKQDENDLTARFRLPLHFKIATSDGVVAHEIDVREREQSFWFSCAEKPKYVSLNPENTILCNLKFTPPRESLIAQLQSDDDVMGRIFAAKTLGKDHSREAVDALGEALKREQFWGVQLEIAEALGTIGSARAQEYLTDNLSRISHPKARKSLVKALGSFKNETSLTLLEKILREDSSPLVQYEAGLAVGKSAVTGVFEKLSGALGKRESWHDYYDRGIVAGLAELKFDDRVFAVLVRSAKPPHSMFLRREAVDALAKWGAARPNAVIDMLMDFTRDSNFFVRLFAIEALERLGDTRAIPALRRVADLVVEPRTKRAAILATKSLRDGKTTNEAAEKLKTELDRMQQEYRALLSRVEKLEKRD